MVERLFPFLKRPPSIAAIVLALILVGAGYLISTYGVLTPLIRFTDYLERSLTSFDAFNVGRIFYSELTGCEIKGPDETGFAVACKPSGDQTLEDLRCARTGECEGRTGVLGTVFLAPVNTIAALWSGSTWLGVLLYAGALTLSGLWLARRLKPEDDLSLWLLWLVLVPAVASVAALGLSWLLALFVFLFSQALAGILWTLATFGMAIAWFKAGMQVFATAHQIENVGKGGPSDEAPDFPEKGK